MSADDLFGDAPTPALRKPTPLTPAPIPDAPCLCGSTSWFLGHPPICRKCGAVWTRRTDLEARPEPAHEEQSPAVEDRAVKVHFERPEDVVDFSRLIGQPLSLRTEEVTYRPEVVAAEAPARDDARSGPQRSLTEARAGCNMWGETLTPNPQADIFGEWWAPLWRGMPSFRQEDLKPMKSLSVRFKSDADFDHFEQKVGQVYHGKWLWFPGKEYSRWRDWRWVSDSAEGDDAAVLKYPVYIISKGRADSRMTARSLDAIGVPYHIVVEPQEFEQYAAVIPPERILQLPFSNLGQGSIPARNWVWEHAKASGAKRHWICDDNIQGFYRLHDNSKIQVTNGAIFRAAEDLADRYENVALAGFQYEFFAMRRQKCAPLALNTRIYSCILIDNALPYRWRGRYNEDTDLSLRALKDGRCTMLFYAFLANKCATMRVSGGNTDELYAGDGRLKMAESLREQHPDVVKVIQKWGRAQHWVNYDGFRSNQLVPAAGLSVKAGPDEYGMKLARVGAEPAAEEQESLPGFPADPVPHAPPAAEAQETVTEVLDVRGALRRLRDYRESAPEPMREAVDVVLARLEPEYPEPAPAPVDGAQAPLFELGAPAPAAAETAEPIRVYVHFERASDVADFGKLLGMQLSSTVRCLRYSRGHAEAAPAGIQMDIGTERSAERDKTFADVQGGLFGSEEWWEQYWKGMPTFVQKDLAPVYSIEMEFTSWDDVDHFENVVDQTVPRGPKRTPSIWFPEAEIGRIAGRAWVDMCDARWEETA